MKKKRIAHSLDFSIEFFKHMTELGTPFESSAYLVRAVAREVKGNRIVELGAGNGPITRGILALHPQAQITAFEINQKLLENLVQIHSPSLRVIVDSAENFMNYVSEFDCVVSGLPLTSMPKEAVDKILNYSKKAKLYIQYKYVPERRLLERYFINVQGKMVWKNIPPAVVYVCRNT